MARSDVRELHGDARQFEEVRRESGETLAGFAGDAKRRVRGSLESAPFFAVVEGRLSHESRAASLAVRRLHVRHGVGHGLFQHLGIDDCHLPEVQAAAIGPVLSGLGQQHLVAVFPPKAAPLVGSDPQRGRQGR
ncbi:hypothetical protein [Scleromatobacter humisilvae]|uniref:Uncharacterized protein n=1 Tax=Scleromatobacter humisilvae TaxID=2897159 RepID=A0A9X1YSP3_9BURK|nr:hypothetical protein [Scleromatobacter humisilvae]MCK9688656.1 hypothetical protein [Scleromatobacter humisilvae]